MELNSLQKLILKKLSQSSLREYFYWTGGTVLSSLYLHRRLSFDIDLFSDKPFNYNDVIPFIKEVAAEAKLKEIEEKKIFDRWEFFLHNKDEVRVEFVHYNFLPLKPRKKWQNIFIDSLEDLSANKTMALIERHEPKDAFDIYCLIKEKHFTPNQLLELVEKKFGVKFSLSLLWSQGMLAAEKLDEIKPTLSPSVNKNKHTKNVQRYFSENSFNFIKNALNDVG